jgi:hypothetical protein
MELGIDAVCQAFEAAGQAAGPDRARPRIEDYLAAMDAAVRGPLLRELVRVELHYRRQKSSGEPSRCCKRIRLNAVRLCP